MMLYFAIKVKYYSLTCNVAFDCDFMKFFKNEYARSSIFTKKLINNAFYTHSRAKTFVLNQ